MRKTTLRRNNPIPFTPSGHQDTRQRVTVVSRIILCPSYSRIRSSDMSVQYNLRLMSHGMHRHLWYEEPVNLEESVSRSRNKFNSLPPD
ncbi:hypothetical protein J6590_033162 [Homalodisca vitripennis]|nr:hypothetical protein J6590_033162 [Homalodisca vitripennis]